MGGSINIPVPHLVESFPAIMKGWIDRFFYNGFAFNAAEFKIYDEGLLKGKKSFFIVYYWSSTGGIFCTRSPCDINQLLT